MARLTDTVRAALGYWWNLVADAARIGLTTTETTSLANDVAQNLGGSLSFQENAAISTLYGYARREINAGNTFTAAQPDRSINADMMSTPPWARDVQEQLTYPLYHVRFEYTYLDQAGSVQTVFRTSVFPDQLPGTVGELQDAVTSDAEAMAAKYGHSLISAVPVNILVV